MEQHAARGWYIADLYRHWLPYYGFGLLALAAGWHRFVRYDGRVSIARSFVPAEWQRLTQAAGLDAPRCGYPANRRSACASHADARPDLVRMHSLILPADAAPMSPADPARPCSPR